MRMRKWIKVSLMSSLLAIAHATSAEVVVASSEAPQDKYAIKLLEKALLWSNDWPVVTSQRKYSLNGRQLALEQKQVDVIWAPARSEVKNDLVAVKVPVYGGMYSHFKLYLPKHTSIGKGISALAELKEKKIGVLAGSIDRTILQVLGLDWRVPAENAYLFRMLDGGRFDALLYPLIHQTEAKEKAVGLDVTDSGFIVSTLNPIWYYVHKDNLKLANSIENGLEKLHSKGAWQELLAQRTGFAADAMKQLSVSKQHLILPNPTMSYLASKEAEKYWHDIDSANLTMLLATTEVENAKK